MTTTATATPTCTLPCPHCHEDEASVSLFLSDGSFMCMECETEVLAEDVEAAITNLMRWRKVYAWAAQLPTE